jgi:hypothetical protein
VIQFARDDLTADELGFLKRLNEGRDCVRIGLVAVIDSIPKDQSRNTVPLSTIWRLEVGLATRCLAAIQNLTLPQTSEASLVLLRNCIEAFAHIEWIKGLSGNPGNTACRALRYELGMTTEAKNTAIKIGPLTGDVATDYARRIAQPRETETGCQCGTHQPLASGHVIATLHKIEKRDPMLHALQLIYSDASRATHMFSGADHFVGLNEKGEPELTWVPMYKRAAWFVWTLLVFGHASFSAEIIIDSSIGSGLQASGAADGLQRLINDPFLERVSRLSDPSRRRNDRAAYEAGQGQAHGTETRHP